MVAQTGGGSIEVKGPIEDRYDEVLSADALALLAALQERFGERRRDLLRRRAERQLAFNRGELPGFLAETADVRNGEWQVAAPAPGILDRRVEITGPPERKMTINALNSGAKVWMADFEDANTPTWTNVVTGQINLADALDRTIAFAGPDGRSYELGTDLATIIVRPRGWHLPERHLQIDGAPVSASLCDFALFMVASAKRQIALGHGPYFYLPKMESHLEARLWNDVFDHAEDALGLGRGTIRATVLIETIPAAFEMEEILFELRDHSAGLNAGRWDYLFSIIKKFHARGAEFTLPDRNSVTMAAPFMHSYTELLVRTCHARGAHAIGGMSAFIPNRRDPVATATALERVEEDKRREASAGFDGSWVAHPDLVPVCQGVFDEVLGAKANQIDRRRDDVVVTASELLDVASAGGHVTEAGLRNDIGVATRYLAAWIEGNGAVAIFNLMEDAATAEIARSQVWQWLHCGVSVEGIGTLSDSVVGQIFEEEADALLRDAAGALSETTVRNAVGLLKQLVLSEEFAEFLTLPAYELLD